MNTWVYQCTAFLFAAGFLGGVKLMQSPETAVKGNSLGAFCMLGAIVMTLMSNGIINDTILWLSLSAGGLIGYWIAIKVTMIQMPQLVAFLNGLGGGASAVTALLVLLHMSPVGLTTGFTGALALSTGSVTLSGSMIAAAKLDQKITQQPVIVPGHSFLSIVTLFLMGMLIILVTFASESALKLISIITIVHALMAGVLFTIRIGGADMPITISLLNALSGLAGSITGFAIHNSLLVAVGAIVGSSGLILTRIMCSAMNRSLVQIITGTTTYSCSKRNALFEQEEEYPDMAATDISTHHNKEEHYQTISSLLR